jgi:hypothetical protein
MKFLMVLTSHDKLGNTGRMCSTEPQAVSTGSSPA